MIQKNMTRTLTCVLILAFCNLYVPAWATDASVSPVTGNDFPQPVVGITYIEAEGSRTCALTSEGGVKCWGAGAAGQLNPGRADDRSAPVDVAGLSSGVMALALGGNHACVLMNNGGVKCWGMNYAGQLGDGTTVGRTAPVDVVGLTSHVMAIAAGSDHTCALTTEGGVKCWGRNNNGQVGDGTAINRNTPTQVLGLTSGATALAAGFEHTCVLLDGSGVKCWGHNGFGQLGDGAVLDRSTPVAVVGLTGGVTALALGGGHSCALMTGGGAKCWGANNGGALGDGTNENRTTPVDVIGLTDRVSALIAGHSHTCALMNHGGVKCWGENWEGQLGDGTTMWRNTPTDVIGLPTGVMALTAGVGHTCALIAGGGVKCWGRNYAGQLGDGEMGWRGVPVDVLGLPAGVTALAVGAGHNCALTGEGGVKCWGSNAHGQLGDGTLADRSTPVDVVGLTSGISALSTSAMHSCARTSVGGIKCWGWNGEGQLGDGTTENRSTPVDVVGLTSGVVAVAVGEWHTCALTGVGGVKCWGINWWGQLGDGTTDNHTTPVDVVGLTSGVTALVVGSHHTCALTSGGVKCWGSNSAGGLGDGTTVDRNMPVDVVGLPSGVTALALGGGYTCALTSGGGVKCWGWNEYGQLGDGTTQDRSMPVDVVGLTGGVTALVAGLGHTCALTSEGSGKCWGYNWEGQLGDGTTTNQATPVDVVGLSSGVTALAAGWANTCALIAPTGRVKCSGSDGYGELGIGTIPRRLTPVDVVESVPALLTVNYVSGQPGSLFTITGWNFPPGALATLSINHQVLTTTVPVNATGSFVVFLDTTDADLGGYFVTASVNPSAQAMFVLTDAAPTRPQEGGGITLNVPPGISVEIRFLYIPLIRW